MFSSFMLNAWLVGTVVAVVAGAVGFFVVLRGATFAAHALPLGGFPGAAAASLFGIDPVLGLCGSCLLGVALVQMLSRSARRDVATALALVMLLGLGALFLSMTRAYAQLVFALLFGEIFGVATGEVALVAAIGALALLMLALAYRPLLLSSAAPELAQARGIATGRLDLMFLLVLALCTATALPVVGALLTFSLMIGPAAVARNLSDDPARALTFSVAIALATVWGALASSYVTDLPVGFFVGSAGIAYYACERLYARVRQRRSVRAR